METRQYNERIYYIKNRVEGVHLTFSRMQENPGIDLHHPASRAFLLLARLWRSTKGGSARTGGFTYAKEKKVSIFSTNYKMFLDLLKRLSR